MMRPAFPVCSNNTLQEESHEKRLSCNGIALTAMTALAQQTPVADSK